MRISPLYEAVVLALGIAASANVAAALAIGKTAPDSITEDLTISGAYDMGIDASSGNQFDFSGKNLSIDITEGPGWGHGNVGIHAGYVKSSPSATQSTINLGNKGKTESISVKVTDNSGKPDIAVGIWAEGKVANDIKGGVININTKSLVVDVTSKAWAYGLYSQNKTTTSTSDLSTININADDIYINATTTGSSENGYSAIAIVAQSQGVMNINGNLEVNADTAISARGGAVLKVNESNTKTVKLNGIIDFNYDGPTSGTKVDADVTVNLTGPESYWNGNAQYSYNGKPSDDKLSVSGLKLGISAGAVWNVTKTVEESSTATGAKTVAINQLTFNDGIISVPDATQTVQIENMTGTGGTINAKTVKNDDGSFSVAKLAVSHVVGAATLTENYVGINADDVTSEDLDNLKAVTADAASLTREQVVSEGDINGGLSRVVNPDGTKGEVLETKNTKQDAYQTLTAMNALAWRHEMNDLTKRMGELRDSPVGIGSWARLYGSEQEYGDQNLKTRSTSVQVGTDFPVGENWKVGAALTYTNGDTSYEVGKADSDSYSGAIYGTWLSESGQFVDLIAKYTRMKSDFSLNGFNGSQDNDALSVSAEYGWHLKLNDLLFVEPQVELTYGRVFGDTFDAEANNAMTIEQDDFDSLIGRVGVRTGFYFPNNKGTVYLRVSGAYDFQGEYEYTARNAQTKRSFKDDLGGAWVEYAVGANFNLTDNAYTYVDLERTSGGEVTENWRWNVGFRYVW